MARVSSLPLDPRGEYVARRTFEFGEQSYRPGDDFTEHLDPEKGLTARKFQQLLNQRFILFAFTPEAQELRRMKADREAAEKATRQAPPEGLPDQVWEIKSAGRGWYDVVTASGLTANTNKLRKHEAEELLASLQGAPEGFTTLEE